MRDRTEYYKQYRSRIEVKEKQRQHQQNWRDNNPDKALQLTRNNRAKHRDEFNKQATKKRKQERVELAAPYVRHQISQRSNFVLMAKDIPDELVELEAIRLYTKRKLKQSI